MCFEKCTLPIVEKQGLTSIPISRGVKHGLEHMRDTMNRKIAKPLGLEIAGEIVPKRVDTT